ncbi:ubiquitin-specific protease otu1 [Actinomortierella wolfii]|nr:ubiquitin-specific protease otu1 [Actinomortierella wolfii]
MRLRIRHKEGIATLSSLQEHSTLLDLLNAIAEVVKAPAHTIECKTGYPPKLLPNDQAAIATLGSLGMRDGDQIIVSENKNAPPLPTAQSVPDNAKAQSPANVVTAVTTTASGPVTSNPAPQPPSTSGTKPVVSKPTPAPQPSLSQQSNPYAGMVTTTGSSSEGVRVDDLGYLVVREVDDDNSCLFNAIAYTLDQGRKNKVHELRRIVVQVIEANPDLYPDVVLGRPRKEYCEWITRENSWGGAIELAIFSEYYKIEIASIDVSTNRVDRFDYDAVALTLGADIPAECDQTQFDVSAEEILQAGIQLAAKLKKEHKYTDLANFRLKCSICGAGLRGEKDAQQHAQQTFHTAFEEYH